MTGATFACALAVTAVSMTKVALKDEKGSMATITVPDVMQSNGVIPVIASVAMPK